ncbi:MAG: site-2 protease family protein [Deltaproteobacteria bacterium]|nr:site-2 protease family protein [Deltaproteobacteria bacterium]
MIERLPYLVAFYFVLLFSLSVHEAAHAWVSNRKGDPTARLLGRITLNPVPHMDLLGTVILPIAALLTGAPLFGWGKPVPVDARYLANPRRDFLWIAAAGPISNLCLAALLAGIGRFFLPLFVFVPALAGSAAVVYDILRLSVILNCALAIFNLIPVFPLDGSSILRGMLPPRLVSGYDRFAQYGMFLLLFLFISGALRFVVIPVTVLAAWLLPQ